MKIVAQVGSSKRKVPPPLAEHPDAAANPKYLTCLGLDFFHPFKGKKIPQLVLAPKGKELV